MKIELTSIADLKLDFNWKNCYETQSDDSLLENIKMNDQLTPICITKDGTVIDGYRRVECLKKLGLKTVLVYIHEGDATILTRIGLNHTREKTFKDRLFEIKEIFERYPKRQGKNPVNGEKYIRDKAISAALNNRWKGDGIIRKLEYVLKNDIPNNALMRGIIDKNEKIDTCYKYLKDEKPIDEKNNYGYTQKIISGEITVSDAQKCIKKLNSLSKEKNISFIIPDKGSVYNIDCIKISKISEIKNSVDLQFTSPPYFDLRNYQNGQSKQLGQEKTPEIYIQNLVKIYQNLLPTLKETSNVIINIGDTYRDGVGLGIPYLLKDEIERKTSLVYKDTLIWSKTNPKPQRDNVKRPINSIEYLLWFVVDPIKAKYNQLTYGWTDEQPKVTKGVKDVDSQGKIWKSKSMISSPYKKIFSHIKEQDIIDIIQSSCGKNHDVHRILQDPHPAVMSPVLPIVPILMTTDEGDLVFDPMAGTNVVGRMAALLNRRSLATEISNKYYPVACEMLQNSIHEFDRKYLDIINHFIYPSTSYKIAA